MENQPTAYDTWRTRPDRQSTTAVLKQLDPVINSSLHSYGLDKDPVMRATASTYAISALPRFDPAKGVKLETFMFNELKRMQRIAPKHQYAIPRPEQAMLDSKMIDKAQRTLTEELGREPTVPELSDSVKLSPKRIQSIRQHYQRPTSSEVQEAPEEDLAESLWLDAVYDELDPTDQKIMDWTMGRNGQDVLSKRDMAVRLGVSAPAVTKRAQRIAARLQEGQNLAL